MEKLAKWLFYYSIFILVPSFSFAQNAKEAHLQSPPIAMEVLAGNSGFATQMIIYKTFQGIPRIGFFSVTNISSKWREPVSNDAMNQVNLTFEVLKGVKIFGGMHYTPVTGLRPTTALMYSKASKTFLLSIGPRIDLSKNSTIEGFAMVEYKPVINENWSFYSRLQGIYVEKVSNGEHARSYLMLRAGLSYKAITFGWGANWDAFGAEKMCKQNYGVFLATRLFN